MFDHRPPQRRTILFATIVALVAAVSFTAPRAAAAATATTMVPACSGINVRTAASIASTVKATLGANTSLTVVAKVSGGSWRTACPNAKAGTAWYRVSAINGTTVKARYGVTYLYAAAGVLTALPGPAPKTPTTDAFGADLMRLINLDRQALGKKPYLIDPRLAEIARDARFTCPTDPKKAFNGRARDMADRGYFAHEVPGCYSSGTTPFRSVEIVRRVFGYAGARSEILHWNSDRGTETANYRLGCDIDGESCSGDRAPAPYRVAVAQRNFMSSAPHRAAELNSYQRFGCGSATVPGTSKTYFACLFADGGSSITPPTPTPPPTPAPAPTTSTTKAPICAGVNLRTGPSTSRAVKVRLRTSSRVTVVATVAGSHWSASCAGPKSGSRWSRISKIDGRSVKSLYGVTWLYAASGLLRRPS